MNYLPLKIKFDKAEINDNESYCETLFLDEEPFIKGHFPNKKLVPGVILTKSIQDFCEKYLIKNEIFILKSANSIMYKYPIYSNQVINIIVNSYKNDNNGETFKYKIFYKDKLASTGELYYIREGNYGKA